MKIESKKGTLYLGTIVAYDDKSIKIKDEEAVNAFPLVERAAEQLKKCHLKEGMFISLFVVNGLLKTLNLTADTALSLNARKKTPMKYTRQELTYSSALQQVLPSAKSA